MRYFQHKWPAILLWPLSLLYAAVISIRNLLYDYGIKKSFKVPCKVISVGNITVGGTGKTPTVITLARELAPKKVCIISRGYGRTSRGPVIVSNYQSVLADVEQSGDEPRMMALALPGVPVIVDRDRVNGARLAIEKFHPDIIILDDGFQHRRLHRDVDIVTLGGERPFGNGMVLPAGPLREPLRNLKRGHVYWLNGATEVPAQLKSMDKPVILADYVTEGLYNIRGEFISKDLDQTPVAAFTGLANPGNFVQTLHGMGADLKVFISYKDHYRYTQQDIIRLKALFTKHDIQWLITTDKDRVKLPVNDLDPGKWGTIKITIAPRNRNEFVTWVKTVSH